MAHIGPPRRAIALVGDSDARALDIGLNSTLGVAAVILALGGGSTLSRHAEIATVPAVEQNNDASLVSAPEPTAPPRPARVWTGKPQPKTAPAAALVEVVDDSEIAQSPPPEPLRLALANTEIPQDRLQFGAPPVWGRGPHADARSAGLKGALRSSASGLVGDWRAPQGDDHEVSLFVSSNDEALSWSLSHASRNYGGVAYQKDRVDIGDAAAGLAVSIGDAQVAAAYVQRDVGSNFGSHSQDYGGIILTLRH